MNITLTITSFHNAGERLASRSQSEAERKGTIAGGKT